MVDAYVLDPLIQLIAAAQEEMALCNVQVNASEGHARSIAIQRLEVMLRTNVALNDVLEHYADKAV